MPGRWRTCSRLSASRAGLYCSPRAKFGARGFAHLAPFSAQDFVSTGAYVSELDPELVSLRDPKRISRSPRVRLMNRPSMRKPARPSGSGSRRQPRTFTRTPTLRVSDAKLASTVEPGGDEADEASVTASALSRSSNSTMKASPPRFSTSGIGAHAVMPMVSLVAPGASLLPLRDRLLSPSARGACRAPSFRERSRTRAWRARS